MLTRIRIKGYKPFHDALARVRERGLRYRIEVDSLRPLCRHGTIGIDRVHGETLAGRNHMISNPGSSVHPPATQGMVYVPTATREEER